MINVIFKFFGDFRKLFYLLLLLTSWLLTADIVGILFLNKTLDSIFENIKISDLLLIIITHIVLIFSSIVIYHVIGIIRTYILKISPRDYFDEEYRKRYYEYNELLNEAVKSNNQTMFNYYKDFKAEKQLDENQKYLCFTLLILIIIEIYIDDSILKIIINNFNEYSFLKRGIIILFMCFDCFGLLIMLKNSNTDYTEIKK